MKVKQKFSIFLSLALILSLLPTSAFADENDPGSVPHSHCICDNGGTEHDAHEAVVYTAIAADYAGGTLAGNIYLNRDVPLTSSLTVESGTTLNLCLNGHPLNAASGNFPVIEVKSGGTLNLCNCWKDDPDNGMLTGGSCGVHTSGAFAMYGGTVMGNAAENGGGVYVENGTFTMNGGEIKENTATGSGGGVYVKSGEFILNGGKITDNTVSGNGGGVSVENGTFTMNGGLVDNLYYAAIIINNAAENGGGVYVATNGRFVMRGGRIDYNTVLGNGGGVSVGGDCSLMGDVDISSNAKGLEDSNVYLCAGQTLTVAGALNAKPPIGVSTETAATPDAPVAFTAAGDMDYSGAFTSDDTAYRVQNSGSNSAQAVQLTPRDPFLQNGDQTYTSLQKAFDAAQSGDTLVLLDDFTCGAKGATLDGGKSLTFDLNGHIMTSPFNTFTVTGGAALTVTDHSDAGTGKIVSQYVATVEFIRSGDQTGKFILSGGTLIMGGYMILLSSDSELDIRGGRIELSRELPFAIFNLYGTVRVSGGSIESVKNPSGAGFLYNLIRSASTFSMTGGSIIAHGAYTSLGISGETSQTEISGGSISAEKGAAIDGIDNAPLTITGGNISSGGYAAITSVGSGLIHISQTDAKTPTVIANSGGAGDSVLRPSATILISPRDAGSKRVLWVEGGTIQNTYDGSDSKYSVYMSKKQLSWDEDLPVTDLGVMTLSSAACYIGAIWPETSDHSGGLSGGGAASTQTMTVSASVSEQVNQTVNAKITAKALVDAAGKATVNVPEKSVTDAIKAAQDAAKKEGMEKYGISITVAVSIDQTAQSVVTALPQSALNALVQAGVTALNIDSGVAGVSLDLKTLTQLETAGSGSVTVSVDRVRAKNLSDETHSAVGTRPMFNFTVQNGGKTVNEFGGTVSLLLPYVLDANESPSNLCAVYVNEDGNSTWLPVSSYDAVAKAMRVATHHCSTFGIAYREAPVFTDTQNHWAKNDITFAAVRGLLTGTSTVTFNPDVSMTRGMFVTALGRLAGVESTKDTSTRFTDVAASSYCAPYVAWAAEKGITSGTSATAFSPDQAITRQEMAVLLQKYIRAMGDILPETNESTAFADAEAIGAFARDAVTAMQKAGIMNGKSGNRFNPNGTATRAEVTAVLHRYVERLVAPLAR